MRDNGHQIGTKDYSISYLLILLADTQQKQLKEEQIYLLTPRFQVWPIMVEKARQQ